MLLRDVRDWSPTDRRSGCPSRSFSGADAGGALLKRRAPAKSTTSPLAPARAAESLRCDHDVRQQCGRTWTRNLRDCHRSPANPEAASTLGYSRGRDEKLWGYGGKALNCFRTLWMQNFGGPSFIIAGALLLFLLQPRTKATFV